jgi:hypothetical protein
MLAHPSYAPDLVPADFLLFPDSEIAMKGVRIKAVSLFP